MREPERRNEHLRRGFLLEYTTLGWNVVGVAVIFAAVAAQDVRSVALIGFGLDSPIEIGTSTVVVGELSGTGYARQQRALRLIGTAFAALAIYLAVQSTVALIATQHAAESRLGIAWRSLTAIVMFALAAGKARTLIKEHWKGAPESLALILRPAGHAPSNPP